MADLSALQAVPGGQIGSGIAQVFNPNQTLGILRADQARADQLRAMEEQRKARQAALEAKRREDEAVTAEFEVAKGLDFDQPIRELTAQKIQQTMQANRGQPPAVQKQNIANTNWWIKNANEFAKQNKEEFDATDKALSRYYNINPVGRRVFLDAEIKNNPDFYKKGGIATSYAKAIKENPDNIKWDAFGDDLIKTIGEQSFEFTDPVGRKEKASYSQILTDPRFTSGRARGSINYNKAREVVMKNPEALEALDIYEKARVPQLTAADPNLSPVKAAEIAEKEAIDRFFKHRLDISGGQDKTVDKQPKGTSEPKHTVTREPKAATYYYTDLNTGQTKFAKARYQNAETVSFDKPIGAGGNIEVFVESQVPMTDVLGPNGEKTGRKKLDDALEGILIPKADGGYTLGPAFTLKNATKATAYRLLEDSDIPVSNKTVPSGKVRKARGTLIPADQAKRLPASAYERIEGYSFSPAVPELTEGEFGTTMKDSKVSKMRFFARRDQLTELGKYFEKSSKSRFPSFE